MSEEQSTLLKEDGVSRNDSWLLTMSEFMSGAQVDQGNSLHFTESEWEELREEIQDSKFRGMRDWSLLNGQVLGGEYFL